MVGILFEVGEGATSFEVVRAELVRDARANLGRLLAVELFSIGEEVER